MIASLILFPIVALFLIFLFPNYREKWISTIALCSVLMSTLMFGYLLVLWFMHGYSPYIDAGIVLFASPEYRFALDFYMDIFSVAFFLCTCSITLMILLFSKYYMHRDPGYKRFHVTIVAFFIGLSLIIFAGNFEVLFVGWEFIGIASFLLIAFYRDRFLPVKNALKVFGLYRIADGLLLFVLWLMHHTFSHNVQMHELARLVAEQGNSFLLLSILIVVIALIKSAQFPFSYWLPRAMEGPTTSSAIFYGALSVHMGLFLLLRTMPLWEGSLIIKVILGTFGLLTALISTNIARVQPTIKTQIAYASVAQIGLMFIELAVGLHWLAVAHFIGNAFLRTYQLLISPSIVGYLIHEQFFHFETPEHKIDQTFMGKLRASLFVLGIKEWNLDAFMYRVIWKPLKQFGYMVRFLDHPWLAPCAVGLGTLMLYVGSSMGWDYPTLSSVISYAFAGIGIAMYVRAYSMKGSAVLCWDFLFLGHIITLFALLLVAEKHVSMVAWYCIGLFMIFVFGHLVLYTLHRKGSILLLDRSHGKADTYPGLAWTMFFLTLALIAFPITPLFLGEEIFLSSIHQEHSIHVLLFVVGYILTGIAALRMFAHIFFGPEDTSSRETAYLSS